MCTLPLHIILNLIFLYFYAFFSLVTYHPIKKNQFQHTLLKYFFKTLNLGLVMQRNIILHQIYILKESRRQLEWFMIQLGRFFSESLILLFKTTVSRFNFIRQVFFLFSFCFHFWHNL